ncbi:MAG: DNA polymerase III subunit delta [Alphaproteobacteria bacterium]
MKPKPREVAKLLRAPPPEIRAILLYGEDAGLISERAEQAIIAIAGNKDDPFRISVLTGAAVAEDPARLADEADAISLTGGRRAVRVCDAGDRATAALAAWLEDPKGGKDASLVVVEADALASRSSLRKLFEGAENAAAIPCYRDEGAGLSTLIDDVMKENNLTVTAEARNFLADRLGSDRRLSRRELEKLALYATGKGQVTLEDARISIDDSSVVTLDSLSFAVAAGNANDTDRYLMRAYNDGATPIGILRAIARHFERLHITALRIAEGMTTDQALKSLRPEPFFKVRSIFLAQTHLWPPKFLADALGRILETEVACKRTGAPAAILTGHAVHEIAALARRLSRRSS